MNRLRLLHALALAWLIAAPLSAHEVDQYDIPDHTDLADQAEMWDQMLFGAIQRAVENTNRAIDSTPNIPGIREARLAQLHSPSALTWAVRHQLPNAVMAILGTEWKLRAEAKPKDSHLVNAYYSSPMSGTYSKLPYWPDPRILNRITVLRSSTIKVHGQYIGVDKLSHFTAMGAWYYSYYQGARLAGKSSEDAMATARAIGQYGPLSETWLVGGLPTGIYSNADMAANYVGLKYYVNLTEPVKIAGKVRRPMVVRDGDHWKLQPFVQPKYFAMFVSQHFDEVLNPCLYEWTFRERVREAVQARSDAIVGRYARETPGCDTPEYFDKVLAKCRTYYGEDYGHSGQSEKLITVAQTCFDRPAVYVVPNKDIQLASWNEPVPRSGPKTVEPLGPASKRADAAYTTVQTATAKIPARRTLTDRVKSLFR